MNRKTLWMPVVLLLGAAIALGCAVRAGTDEELLKSTGVVQVDEVRIASEFQGTVSEVLVNSGDSVGMGDPVVLLENAGIRSNVLQAQAALNTARSELNRVVAGARPEAVSARTARVAKADAERAGAYAAWESAHRVLHEPQDLEAEIRTAEAQAALAAQNVQFAKADYYQSERARDDAEWNTTERRVLELELRAKKAAWDAAVADEQAAQVALKHLRGMRDEPIGLRALANMEWGKYLVALEAVDVAKAELEGVQAGPTAAEVAVAEAQLSVAQAQLALAQLQLERLTLRSPIDGTVVERMTHAGETAVPLGTLLTVADLSEVYVTVYVPETRVGHVHIGQRVDVTVDSFPERSFEGHVTHIADHAEYTPMNVATKEERVNTVYGVRIVLPNREGLLKPGMAADAVLRG